DLPTHTTRPVSGVRVHCAVLNPQTSPPGSTPPGPGMVTGSQRYGGHGERETPGNIPNPEAKPLSADGTAPGTGWESRTPPDTLIERAPATRPGPFRMHKPRSAPKAR